MITSTRVVEKVTGSLRFKVVDYSLQKEMGIGKFLTSDIFPVGGCDWLIRYYPDGYTEKSKDYIAFFVVLESDTTDVKEQLNFTVLDQRGKPSTLSRTSLNVFQKGYSWGYPEFVERKKFETEYVTDDSFEILCTVTIVKQSFLKSEKFKTVMVPPCNLGQQLCQRGKGADVTFEVGGEFFKAHKPILAAMSPVFSAQFFGLMNEKGAVSIKLDDIEPEVFRVLLHFIYSGSLTEVDGEKQETMILYQHLLVAADQYGVERLKIICENKLTQNIEVINFATTLTLAERHNCSQLNASCLDFVSSPKMLIKVMKADGFEYMNQSCPFILKDLMENTSDDN